MTEEVFLAWKNKFDTELKALELQAKKNKKVKIALQFKILTFKKINP